MIMACKKILHAVFTREFIRMKENQKIAGIQVLRAIAFLEIFLGHCGVEFCSATFGVSIFMMLSGFCMAINYIPKQDSLSLSPVQCVKFGISKVKKLYGLHLIMLLLIYIIVKMPTSGEAIPKLIRDLLLMKCWWTSSDDYFAYNGVTWYLATYLYVCIMAPYVIHLISKIKNKKQLFLAGLIVYALMVVVGYTLSAHPIQIGDGFACWFTYICPLYRVLDFSLGVMLGRFYLNFMDERKIQEKTANLQEIMAVIVFVAAEVLFVPMESRYQGLCYNAFFVPATILLIWVLAKNQGFITGILNQKILVKLGDISAQNFLIHQVVIKWLMFYVLKPSLGEFYVPVMILTSFTITVVLAHGYLLVQRGVRDVMLARYEIE